MMIVDLGPSICLDRCLGSFLNCCLSPFPELSPDSGKNPVGQFLSAWHNRTRVHELLAEEDEFWVLDLT